MNRVILTTLVSAGALHPSLASAQGDTIRAVGGTSVTVTFTVGADGRVAALVMRQGGAERALPKVR